MGHRCLQALGATRSPELLLRTLEFSFTEEVSKHPFGQTLSSKAIHLFISLPPCQVRTSDVPFPVASVASNPAGSPPSLHPIMCFESFQD